jgi:hypothetical protein
MTLRVIIAIFFNTVYFLIFVFEKKILNLEISVPFKTFKAFLNHRLKVKDKTAAQRCHFRVGSTSTNFPNATK